MEYGKLIENAGIFIASLTAIYGISTWRRELRGKKEHDLAEEVLSLVYECRDRLRAIRSPMSSTEEGKTRKTRPDELPEEREVYNRSYVAFERYHANQDPFNRLFAIRYRFMALFGEDKAQPIVDMRLALNDIFISAQMLPTYWLRQGKHFQNDEDFKRHLDEKRKYEAVFWGTFSEKDNFDKRVNSIVDQTESICAKILRPPSLVMRMKATTHRMANYYRRIRIKRAI